MGESVNEPFSMAPLVWKVQIEIYGVLIAGFSGSCVYCRGADQAHDPRDGSPNG